MPKSLERYDQTLLLAELKRRAAAGRRGGPRGSDESPLASGMRRGGEAADDDEELRNMETSEIIKEIRSQQKVIYGVDDRVDMYEVNDSAIVTDAASVVALVDAGSIQDNGDGTSDLVGPDFGTAMNLCDSEPFRDQPVPAWCSGFLVDPSIVATAGHCSDESNLGTTRYVFGFEMLDANTVAPILNDDIYRGLRILGRQLMGQADWTLVQLDRPVLDRPFVRIRRNGQVPDGADVHVIGHPSGLPKKYAAGATVRDNTPATHFVANLDTYGGNSGSPVFNSATHTVEGILVRGETDFVSNGNCMVSNVCPLNGCDGEDCTRTTRFSDLVPDHRTDCIPFDPGSAAIQTVGGRVKIVVGKMWLLDFGTAMAEAERALQIIRHYGLNGQCFVGRPNPSMTYYLVNGETPVGSIANEDSIEFDRNALEVKLIQGRWKIVEGDHWLMDFDQEQGEARLALSSILRHRFSHVCFVGRPQPSMVYFRK